MLHGSLKGLICLMKYNISYKCSEIELPNEQVNGKNKFYNSKKLIPAKLQCTNVDVIAQILSESMFVYYFENEIDIPHSVVQSYVYCVVFTPDGWLGLTYSKAWR